MESELFKGKLGSPTGSGGLALRQLWEFLCCHPTARFNRQALLGVAGFEDTDQLRRGLDILVNAGVVQTFPGGKLYGLAPGTAAKQLHCFMGR
jgi:hypothetical protein